MKYRGTNVRDFSSVAMYSFFNSYSLLSKNAKGIHLQSFYPYTFSPIILRHLEQLIEAPNVCKTCVIWIRFLKCQGRI